MVCLCFQRRQLIRRLNFNDPREDHTPYIFTEVCSRLKKDCKMHVQTPSLAYWKAVHNTYRPFISIILTCEIEEIMERLRWPGRNLNNKPLLRDLEPYYDIDRDERLFEFGTSRELKLDVSYLSPESAAEYIRDHIDGEWNSFALERAFLPSSPVLCFISPSPRVAGIRD